MGSRPAIVFNADEIKSSCVDEAFEDQASAFRSSGFDVWILSSDKSRLITKGADVRGHSILFRGWMMKPEEYRDFQSMSEAGGVKLLVDHDAYKSAHHISGWVDTLAGLTAETKLFPPDCDLRSELTRLGWSEFFIKDFVKSLKTSRGSLVRSLDEVDVLISEMKKYRGEIEGGFAVRRVESFQQGSERRYFVRNGVVRSSDGSPPPEIAFQAASRFRASPFFSIDVALDDKGVHRVVEIGDGQVSDLVGWTPERFVSMWLD